MHRYDVVVCRLAPRGGNPFVTQFSCGTYSHCTLSVFDVVSPASKGTSRTTMSMLAALEDLTLDERMAWRRSEIAGLGSEVGTGFEDFSTFG